MNLCKCFFGAVLAIVTFFDVAMAVELQGTVPVNVTSDTAAAAKNKAFNDARRQIIVGALRQYADVTSLNSAVGAAKNAELMNLIAASSIDGEQFSDTAYSANITMVLDADAARVWLTENGVQNWIPDGTNVDTFVVQVNMSDGLKNWVELNQIARAEKFDLNVRYLSQGTATLNLPKSVRGRFTIALREAGWRYANSDGNLKIWK